VFPLTPHLPSTDRAPPSLQLYSCSDRPGPSLTFFFSDPSESPSSRSPNLLSDLIFSHFFPPLQVGSYVSALRPSMVSCRGGPILILLCKSPTSFLSIPTSSSIFQPTSTPPPLTKSTLSSFCPTSSPFPPRSRFVPFLALPAAS